MCILNIWISLLLNSGAQTLDLLEKLKLPYWLAIPIAVAVGVTASCIPVVCIAIAIHYFM